MFLIEQEYRRIRVRSDGDTRLQVEQNQFAARQIGLGHPFGQQHYACAGEGLRHQPGAIIGNAHGRCRDILPLLVEVAEPGGGSRRSTKIESGMLSQFGRMVGHANSGQIGRCGNRKETIIEQLNGYHALVWSIAPADRDIDIIPVQGRQFIGQADIQDDLGVTLGKFVQQGQQHELTETDH